MISMQILPCVIDLDPLPTYPKYVEIAPYGNVKVADCDTEDGWMFLPDAENPTQVKLCGAACTDFQMSGALDIEYRCPPGQ